MAHITIEKYTIDVPMFSQQTFINIITYHIKKFLKIYWNRKFMQTSVFGRSNDTFLLSLSHIY